jgi:hypothetical protein
MDFSYLSTTLLVRATMGKHVRYFVNAGICVSYLLNEMESDDATFTKTSAKDQTSSYHSLDAALCAGTGLLVRLNGKTTFSAELRENYGVTNTDMGNTLTFNTIALQFGVNWKLGRM